MAVVVIGNPGNSFEPRLDPGEPSAPDSDGHDVDWNDVNLGTPDVPVGFPELNFDGEDVVDFNNLGNAPSDPAVPPAPPFCVEPPFAGVTPINGWAPVPSVPSDPVDWLELPLPPPSWFAPIFHTMAVGEDGADREPIGHPTRPHAPVEPPVSARPDPETPVKPAPAKPEAPVKPEPPVAAKPEPPVAAKPEPPVAAKPPVDDVPVDGDVPVADDPAQPTAPTGTVTGNTVGSSAGRDRLQALLARTDLCFEDLMALVMFEIIHQNQDEIRGRLKAMQSGGTAPTQDAKPSEDVAATADDSAVDEPDTSDAPEAAAPAEPAQGGGGFFDVLGKIIATVVTGVLATMPPIGTLLAPLAAAIIPTLIHDEPQKVKAAVEGKTADAPATTDAASDAPTPKPASATASKPTQTGASTASTSTASTATAEDKQAAMQSRSEQFELIKLDMQKLSEMQQTLSAILDMSHETAKHAIQNIR